MIPVKCLKSRWISTDVDVDLISSGPGSFHGTKSNGATDVEIGVCKLYANVSVSM